MRAICHTPTPGLSEADANKTVQNMLAAGHKRIGVYKLSKIIEKDATNGKG